MRRPTRRSLLPVPALLVAARAAAQGGRAPDPALAALVEGEAVALIRHAAAPGTGDPPGFRLGDCSTQRNLSDEGRRQAAALGRRLRDAGVLVTEVRSSRWCRASETASLAFPARPLTPDSALDSLFRDPDEGESRTARVRRTIEGWRGRQGVLALVTHQVNIARLTGLSVGAAEIVVVRPGIAGFEVVGRIRA